MDDVVVIKPLKLLFGVINLLLAESELVDILHPVAVVTTAVMVKSPCLQSESSWIYFIQIS